MEARLAINLRLPQRVTVRGPTRKDGTQDTREVGLKDLDCADCPDYLRKLRGCRLPGWHETPLQPFRVDRYDQDEGLWVAFCPASVRHEATRAAIDGAIKIESLSTLGPFHPPPVGALPFFYVETHARALEARDRFVAELGDAQREMAK